MHIDYVPSYYSCISLILFILMLVASVQYYVHSASLLTLFFAAPSACSIVNKSVGPDESSRILFELTLCTARLEMLIHKHSVIHHPKSPTFSAPVAVWETCPVAAFQVIRTLHFCVREKRGKKRRKKRMVHVSALYSVTKPVSFDELLSFSIGNWFLQVYVYHV